MRRILTLKTVLPLHNLGTAALEAKHGIVFEPEEYGVTISREGRSFFVPWDKIAWCTVEALPAKRAAA